MNIKIFLANPPPGAASWTVALNERKNGFYFTHWLSHVPLDTVLDVDLEYSTVHLMVVLYNSGGGALARQDIYPDFTITGGIYAYNWYSNKLIKTDHIPAKVIRQTRYWLTIARGKTPEELEEQIGPYEAADRWQITIKTNLPSTILTGFFWASYPFFWTFKQAVAAAGGEVEKMEVVGSEFRMHIHASPFAFAALIPLLKFLIPAITVVLVAMVVRDIIVQKELTEQAYYAYKEAETYKDVLDSLTSPSYWVCQECGYVSYAEIDVCPVCASVNIKRDGGLGITDPAALELFIDAFPQSEPETDDRWYEKYIRYALIGVGVILGVALLAPPIIKAIRGGK